MTLKRLDQRAQASFRYFKGARLALVEVRGRMHTTPTRDVSTELIAHFVLSKIEILQFCQQNPPLSPCTLTLEPVWCASAYLQESGARVSASHGERGRALVPVLAARHRAGLARRVVLQVLEVGKRLSVT